MKLFTNFQAKIKKMKEVLAKWSKETLRDIATLEDEIRVKNVNWRLLSTQKIKQNC